MSAEGYSGTPLARKLGITEGDVIALLSAPAGFLELLPDLPPDVVFRAHARGRFAMAISFQTDRAVLERRIEPVLRGLPAAGALWVAWPKKASKVPTDITEDTIREVVLPRGLVDVKVCAIDATWSGLKVVRRRELR